jgi:hypothetical protein
MSFILAGIALIASYYTIKFFMFLVGLLMWISNLL